MLRRTYHRLDALAERWSQDRFFLWKLFAVALALRAAFVCLHFEINLLTDMLGYHESAMSLLKAGEFRVKGRLSAARPPLYAIFMYYIYYLFGDGNLFAVRLSQAALGAVNVVLTFVLTAKVFSRKAAVWAGLGLAFYPAAIGFSDLILTEVFFTFLLLCGLIFLVDFAEGRYRDAILAGIFLGLATLTRTVLYQFPLFFAVGYLIFSKKRWRHLPNLAIFVVSFWLVLLPWVARNLRVFDKPLMTTKSGVDLFLYNHNPFLYILYNYSLEDKATLGDVVIWKLSEVEKDEWCRQKAVAWIKGHPFLFLFKGVRMVWNLFSVDREFVWLLFWGYWGQTPRWQLTLLLLLFTPTIYLLMPLFIWGVVYCWRASPKILILLAMLLYNLAVTFVYYGYSRNRMPLNPILLGFAGFALTQAPQLWEDLKRPGIWKRPKTAIAIGLLIFFIIGWLLEIYTDIGSFFRLGFTFDSFNP